MAANVRPFPARDAVALAKARDVGEACEAMDAARRVKAMDPGPRYLMLSMIWYLSEDREEDFIAACEQTIAILKGGA
jgi:acyl-CoA reductase-like NAD-dependent aldehyde dehydrogenase